MAIDPNTGLYYPDASPFPGGMFGGALEVLNAQKAQQIADQNNQQRQLKTHAMELSNQLDEQNLQERRLQHENQLKWQNEAPGFQTPEDAISGAVALMPPAAAASNLSNLMWRQGRLGIEQQNADTKSRAVDIRGMLDSSHAAYFDSRKAAIDQLTPLRAQDLQTRQLVDQSRTMLNNAHAQLAQLELAQQTAGTTPQLKQAALRANQQILDAERVLLAAKVRRDKAITPQEKADANDDIAKTQSAIDAVKASAKAILDSGSDSGAGTTGTPIDTSTYTPFTGGGQGQPYKGGVAKYTYDPQTGLRLNPTGQ